jgi:hypothetical protein
VVKRLDDVDRIPHVWFRHTLITPAADPQKRGIADGTSKTYALRQVVRLAYRSHIVSAHLVMNCPVLAFRRKLCTERTASDRELQVYY